MTTMSSCKDVKAEMSAASEALGNIAFVQKRARTQVPRAILWTPWNKHDTLLKRGAAKACHAGDYY